jgi:single-strand selective monofunctional uracil DNA glycosylase
MELVEIGRTLARAVDALTFAPPVAGVYNPLAYAWAPYEQYVTRFGAAPKEVVLVGMNPGPFGMVQTGVPFGDIVMVRDWMGIEAPVGQPKHPFPGRPVEGFAVKRREASGTRLWGWAQARFGTPEAFFARFFVINYCPLAFFDADGTNRTPDKLPIDERRALFAPCDRALRDTVAHLGARFVIGVGSFATARIYAACADLPVVVDTVLHPSPANPKANAGWAAQVDAKLTALGIL